MAKNEKKAGNANRARPGQDALPLLRRLACPVRCCTVQHVQQAAGPAGAFIGRAAPTYGVAPARLFATAVYQPMDVEAPLKSCPRTDLATFQVLGAAGWRPQ